jgi:hypothetical protein
MYGFDRERLGFMHWVVGLLILVMALHHVAMSSLPFADAMALPHAASTGMNTMLYTGATLQVPCNINMTTCPTQQGAHVDRRPGLPHLPSHIAYQPSAAAQPSQATLPSLAHGQVLPATRKNRRLLQVLRI